MDKLKTIGGKRHKLCGGYVSWDGRKKDDSGWPIRRSVEVRVYIPCGVDGNDCGAGTNLLVAALVAKFKKVKGERSNVECRESWEY